ncbi:hypothetical protein CRENBAI_026657 [Crenichthys baileyi]|uniref:Uncharacterized protein n=1 Tax=Crenichthys baileyi TaxID=28760 RepID=A0AAV9QQ30_9TELE
MPSPRLSLHFGPHKPQTMTVQTSQKDQAAGEEFITLFEYFRRAAEKSARQATEREELRSPFWGTKLARPLPGTGTLRYQSSPSSHRRPPPPEATSFQYCSSEPEFGAVRFLCPVRDSSPPPLHSPCFAPAPSRRRQRRHRDAPLSVPEGCANASSPLPEGLVTASLYSTASPAFFLASSLQLDSVQRPTADPAECPLDAFALTSAKGRLTASASTYLSSGLTLPHLSPWRVGSKPRFQQQLSPTLPHQFPRRVGSFTPPQTDVVLVTSAPRQLQLLLRSAQWLRPEPLPTWMAPAIHVRSGSCRAIHVRSGCSQASRASACCHASGVSRGVRGWTASDPEGFKDELPLLPVPEGFKDEPPLFPVPEGFEDEPPLLPVPEGFEDEPPLLPVPEGFEDQPPLLPVPEGFEDQPPLLPVPEGFEEEPPLLPVPEGFEDEPPLLPVPEGFEN